MSFTGSDEDWKERNLLSLAAELGLIELSDRININLDPRKIEGETSSKSSCPDKTFSQLT